MEEDEENFNFLMDAATGEFVTANEFVAMGVIGLIQARWNRVAIKKLMDHLEKKGVVTREERVELNENLKKTMRRMMDGTQERYPAFAKAAKAAEEYEKQHP